MMRIVSTCVHVVLVAAVTALLAVMPATANAAANAAERGTSPAGECGVGAFPEDTTITAACV